MDLSTVVAKIDTHQYLTAKDFLVDIDLICNNALEYNPDKDPGGEEENVCFKFYLFLPTPAPSYLNKSKKRFLKKKKNVFLKNTQSPSQFKPFTFMLKMVYKCGKSLIQSF